MRSVTAVLYADPIVTSIKTCWCLEKVNGAPVLSHLLRRLHSGLCGHNIPVIVACRREEGDRIRSAVPGDAVTVFAFRYAGRRRVLTELSLTHDHIKTLVVFPANAIFPDCVTSLAQLRLHLETVADLTYPAEPAIGLLPEIVEASALTRLANLITAADSDEIPDLMFRANNFNNRVARPFRIRKAVLPDSYYDRLGEVPVRVVVDDQFTRRAAEAVLNDGTAASLTDHGDAVKFKTHLLRQKGAVSMSPPAVIHPTKAAILYTTLSGGYSGAEESLFSLISNIDRRRFYPVALLPVGCVLADRLRAAGVPTGITEMSATLLSPEHVDVFCSAIADYGVRLIHVNGPPFASLVCAAYRERVPIISHMRVVSSAGSNYLRFAHRIIVVSEATRHSVLRGQVDPDKVSCVYNGVDIDRFAGTQGGITSVRDQAGIPPDRPVILMVSRIADGKRQHVLIEALPQVLDRFPDAVVLIVGEAYPWQAVYYEHLLERVKQLGVQDSVRLWGFELDTPAIYKAATAMALCSEREAFARCILEAFAAGIPVIAPRRGGGHTETFSHGRELLLYDGDSAADLSSTIIALLTDADLQKRLSRNARECVRRFDIASHVARVEKIYDEILGAHCTKLSSPGRGQEIVDLGGGHGLAGVGGNAK